MELYDDKDLLEKFIKGDYIIKDIDGDNAESIFIKFYLNPEYFNKRLISIYYKSWQMGYVDSVTNKKPRYRKKQDDAFFIDTLEKEGYILDNNFKKSDLYKKMIIENQERQIMLKGYFDGYHKNNALKEKQVAILINKKSI